MGHALGRDLFGQGFAQGRQRPGLGQSLAGKGGGDRILGFQLLHGIPGGGGVEQIRRELCVKADGLAHAPGLEGQAVQGFCVEHIQLGPALKQVGQAGGGHGPDALRLHGVPFGPLAGQVHPALHQQGQSFRLHRGKGGGVRFFGGGVGRGKPQAAHQRVNFQLGQQGRGRGRVALIALVGAGGGFHGGRAVDLGQGAGQLGLGLVGFQLCPHAGLDGRVGQVLVHAGQAAELLDQGEGGLFAHARHAGDIIGRVAHEAFYLDELPGGNAVFFGDGFGVHADGLAAAHAGGGQQHGDLFAHQL